jgi:hypothetical protein
MRARLVYLALFVVLTAFGGACGGSKSSAGRDGAVPPNDSPPGSDVEPDVPVPDGSSADRPVDAEDAAKDARIVDLGRDTALPDGPAGAETADKDTNVADLGRDTAPDAAIEPDANRQETVGDGALLETAGANDNALESGSDSAGTSVDGALAAFCTGDYTRSMVDGTAGAPTVRTSRIATGCCDGFELQLNSATFASAIFVDAIASGVTFVPVDIDLGNPPRGWTFGVWIDCDATRASCKQQLDSGLVGTFRTARVLDSGAIDLSLCLHAEDAAGSRRLDLYIPHTVAN